MARVLGRMKIGLAITVVTVGGLAILRLFVATIREDWLAVVVLALFGESLLLLFHARHSGPPRVRPAALADDSDQDESPAQPDLLPEALGIDPQWLWNLLPSASVAFVLFLVILLKPTS